MNGLGREKLVSAERGSRSPRPIESSLDERVAHGSCSKSPLFGAQLKVLSLVRHSHLPWICPFPLSPVTAQGSERVRERGRQESPHLCYGFVLAIYRTPSRFSKSLSCVHRVAFYFWAIGSMTLLPVEVTGDGRVDSGKKSPHLSRGFDRNEFDRSLVGENLDFRASPRHRTAFQSLAQESSSSHGQEAGRTKGASRTDPSSGRDAGQDLVHLPESCSCGYSGPFEEEDGLPVESRQVLDLPPQTLIATEHRCPVQRCPGCRKTVRAPFPAEAAVPVQYGPNFKSFLAYIHSV